MHQIVIFEKNGAVRRPSWIFSILSRNGSQLDKYVCISIKPCTHTLLYVQNMMTEPDFSFCKKYFIHEFLKIILKKIRVRTRKINYQ